MCFYYYLVKNIRNCGRIKYPFDFSRLDAIFFFKDNISYQNHNNDKKNKVGPKYEINFNFRKKTQL